MTVAMPCSRDPLNVRLGRSFPVGSICLGILAINIAAAAMLHPAIIGATDGAPGLLPLALWVAAVISPVLAILKALIFAAVTWSLASLAAEHVELRRCIVVALVGEAILALSAIFTAIVIFVRGGAATPADLRVPQGIDLFVDVPPGWPASLVEYTGLFNLFWLVWLYFGLRAIVGLRRSIALLATGCFWVLLVATSVLRLTNL